MLLKRPGRKPCGTAEGWELLFGVTVAVPLFPLVVTLSDFSLGGTSGLGQDLDTSCFSSLLLLLFFVSGGGDAGGGGSEAPGVLEFEMSLGSISASLSLSTSMSEVLPFIASGRVRK